MFAKAVVSSTLLALVAATVTTMPASECTTGPVQCCDSTTSTITSPIATLFSLLGIDASSVAVPIGLTCDPITVIGVGSGASCSAEPVCCSNNSYNGVVALGCSPVNLSL